MTKSYYVKHNTSIETATEMTATCAQVLAAPPRYSGCLGGNRLFGEGKYAEACEVGVETEPVKVTMTHHESPCGVTSPIRHHSDPSSSDQEMCVGGAPVPTKHVSVPGWRSLSSPGAPWSSLVTGVFTGHFQVT